EHDTGPAGPPLVPDGRELLAVEVDVDAVVTVAVAMVWRPLRRAGLEVDSKPPVELRHRVHVANDAVDQVELCHVHHQSGSPQEGAMPVSLLSPSSSAA